MAELGVDAVGGLGVDERHRALGLTLFPQEVVGGLGEHVNDGVSDAHYVDGIVLHGGI